MMRVGREHLKAVLLRFVYYTCFVTVMFGLRCQFLDGCYSGWFVRGLVLGPTVGLLLAILATIADRGK